MYIHITGHNLYIHQQSSYTINAMSIRRIKRDRQVSHSLYTTNEKEQLHKPGKNAAWRDTWYHSNTNHRHNSFKWDRKSMHLISHNHWKWKLLYYKRILRLPYEIFLSFKHQSHSHLTQSTPAHVASMTRHLNNYRAWNTVCLCPQDKSCQHTSETNSHCSVSKTRVAEAQISMANLSF